MRNRVYDSRESEDDFGQNKRPDADLRQCEALLERANKTVAALRAGFEIYADHGEDCTTKKADSSEPCDCGYAELWQTWVKP